MNKDMALLETRDVSVGIGGKVFCRQLNLCVKSGECLGILGRNGAGKSTLLSVLAGIREPLSGKVLLNGKSYQATGPQQSALIRGWLPQSRGDAFASSVLETAMVGRHPHIGRWNWESEEDQVIVREALRLLDLNELEQRDIQTLSGGERQRLAIATLLAQSPSLYLLDEATAYLDLKHQMSVLSLFSNMTKAGSTSAIMILHDPALVWRFCDQVLLVYGNGETESGSVEEMLTEERLSALFEYPVKVLHSKELISFIPGSTEI